MKTRIFKMVLPFFAILMAISLSFATEANRTMNDPGYYDDPFIPGVQEVPGGVDCPLTGEIQCTYNGHLVYANQALTDKRYEKQ